MEGQYLWSHRDQMHHRRVVPRVLILKILIGLLLVALVLALPVCIHAQYHTQPVIGGENASASSYPWFAQLRQVIRWNDTVPSNFGLCGASLVAPDLLVTAAHCVFAFPYDLGAPPLAYFYPHFNKVYFGRSSANEAPSLIAEIKEVMVHPHYNPADFSADIALIRLKQKVPFSALAPITNDEFAKVNVGADATIVGWGISNAYTGIEPSYLQAGNVPLVSNQQCADSNGAYFQPHSMFCAGTAGKDTCNGDSGGPLVVTVEGEQRLAGITSWGLECASSNSYGVYTRVAQFHEFITRAPSEFPPVPTRSARLKGGSSPGEKVTCIANRWRGRVQKKRYQWFRAPAYDDYNGWDSIVPQLIEGQKGKRYRITAADLGSEISCGVTGVNEGGESFYPAISESLEITNGINFYGYGF